jgi:hypothetical protein
LRMADKLADVILISNDGKEFPTSRFLLYHKSGLFAGLLSSNFADADKKKYDMPCTSEVLEYITRTILGYTTAYPQDIIGLYKVSDEYLFEFRNLVLNHLISQYDSASTDDKLFTLKAAADAKSPETFRLLSNNDILVMSKNDEVVRKIIVDALLIISDDVEIYIIYDINLARVVKCSWLKDPLCELSLSLALIGDNKFMCILDKTSESYDLAIFTFWQTMKATGASSSRKMTDDEKIRAKLLITTIINWQHTNFRKRKVIGNPENESASKRAKISE